MKQQDLPEKCKSCSLYSPKSLYCSAYALKCAKNELGKSFLEAIGIEGIFDYECENYVEEE